MRYKLLGKSGLRVSELCLGTMTFGEDWGWGASRQTSRRIFELFAEAGGNFIDTANLYTNGTSETIVGELVKPDRDRWVVATKYSLDMGIDKAKGDPNLSGNHRKNMVQAVEASLKRLQIEYIDLLWLHAWDFTTPVEEVMRAFDDLVRAGKVLYIGISDAPAWIISHANTLAELRGWTQFVGIQIEYSLKERTPERDLIPMAQHFQIGVTAWSPLASGLLSGKYNQGGEVDAARASVKEASERDLKIASVVCEVGKEIGRAPSQVALNWLLHKGKTIIPILGARKVEQFQENLGCLEFSLSPEHMQRLDDASAIALGFPHDFLKSSIVQDFAFGGSLSRIDF